MKGHGRSLAQARRATLAGLAACLVGIGLARFAYTPLIPALIDAGWFSPAEAAYLGAANLVGYLVGALAGRRLAAIMEAAGALRLLMLLAATSFLACAAPLSFAWFAVWRCLSGIAGGGLMVLAAPTVLPHVPAAYRGFAGGVIFTGVGLGIAASGTIVPMLRDRGLVATWCALGGVALVLTLAAWRAWPTERPPLGSADGKADLRGSDAGGTPPALRALYIEYGLNAAGLVPHMVFLVDFIARGLGQGLAIGAAYWVVFGLGATIGPVLAGTIADRIGFKATLRSAFLVQAAAIGLLIVLDQPLALGVSSLVIGAFVPGIGSLVLGRAVELLPAGSQGGQAAWTWCTTSFAFGQAVAAYGLSFLFAQTHDYHALFALGAAFLLAALVLDLTVDLSVRNRPHGVREG